MFVNVISLSVEGKVVRVVFFHLPQLRSFLCNRKDISDSTMRRWKRRARNAIETVVLHRARDHYR